MRAQWLGALAFFAFTAALHAGRGSRRGFSARSGARAGLGRQRHDASFRARGIENTERRRDLSGPTQNEEDQTIAPRVGGSATFRKFLRDELLPDVKARYRTTDETAIVGESLAGFFVIETFLLEPALFDTYIAIDPSLWWNDGSLVKSAAERLREQSKSPKALWFASSGEQRGDWIFRAVFKP